ncbi:MAG: Coenzyme F420 hydrogenase/dehydrogenase, beta subunit C-terminal domain [Chitinispirillaceae bacterium]|nr:Coenzyme F420 hydrogenase/dehydrogenase, beta subunit C-terminal domain [Chitinispirillaceae bacterium]
MQIYTDKKDCCGCGACFNICPKHAINMQEDEYGFIYPAIDQTTCVNCGLCKDVCARSTHQETNKPFSVFAGISKNTDILQSASGGIFASLATSVLNDGGIVYGVSMETVNNVLTPMHIMVDDKAELLKLLGSKYVQSFTGFCYSDVKKNLEAGKTILFSGTPCQIAGLRGFLGKDYPSLFLVDIICHGVPSARFFSDYTKLLENKLKGKINNIVFRDKQNGWGLTAKISYAARNGKCKTALLPSKASSYYSLFLNSSIYRECCYSCKYASNNRPGDITVGDYWGIQKEHPELTSSNPGKINILDGCSCILINSSKGSYLLSKNAKKLDLYPSTFEKVAKHNRQLKEPSSLNTARDSILKTYVNYGYKKVDLNFSKTNRKVIYFETLKIRIPVLLRIKLKMFISRFLLR